jgi:WD40 repeat protein
LVNIFRRKRGAPGDRRERRESKVPVVSAAPPPGATPALLRKLHGHTAQTWRIAWSPDGQYVASPSADGTVRLWDLKSGSCIRVIKTYGYGEPRSAAFSPTHNTLAIGHVGFNVTFWDPATGNFLDSLQAASGERPGDFSSGVVFTSTVNVVTAQNGHVALWDPELGEYRWSADFQARETNGIVAAAHPSLGIFAVPGDGGSLLLMDENGTKRASLAAQYPRASAFNPAGSSIAVENGARVDIWSLDGILTTQIEGHKGRVGAIAFSHDGLIMASRGWSGETLLWDTSTWTSVATINGPQSDGSARGAAFHPSQPLLALAYENDVHIYVLDPELFGGSVAPSGVRYASAKVVLVGESGVGKTGLGWRLSHGEFKEHASTHGQQFWLLDELGTTRSDGAQCEAVLWDLAGQPDYRLIHALFLDDADLALVVFDPSRDDDPFPTVDYWLRQLRASGWRSPNVVLVAGRADRGVRVSDDDIRAFCRSRGIAQVVITSALTGQGLPELVSAMKAAIDWNSRPSTITTDTFKQIKDYVLGLKETAGGAKAIVDPEQLRAGNGYTAAETATAVGHLATHGYVTWLRGSTGQRSVLLAPELLNNLAASIVLEARRNPKGLGSLEEKSLLSGEYQFPEFSGLSRAERDLLLDSAVAMFLSRNVCFRSADPLSRRTYLVFPNLINLRRPVYGDDLPVEEAVSYGISGPTENLYASVVVILGYTSTFMRTDQWRNHARYVMGDDLVCDLRVEPEASGELTFVISYGPNVGANVRTLFQSLVESLLSRPDLTVQRYPRITCARGHRLARSVQRDRLADGYAFCPGCGERLTLPPSETPVKLTMQQAGATAADRRVANDRSRFEEAVFRLVTYAKRDGPSCFISYAWGRPDQERWVEHTLATDLAKAGIEVILDRWENARFGASLPRFVERVHTADRVVVVGTPQYRTKYVNDEPMRGFVVAAEGELIGVRMIGTEKQKASVVPVLLEGDDERRSFPPLLLGRHFADFRDSSRYFMVAFDLMLSLYGIDTREPAIAELRREVSNELGRPETG